MRTFYPQCLVRVTVIYSTSLTTDDTGEETFMVKPRSVRIDRNDFNTADTCEIELDSQHFPLMPRVIRQVLIQVYAGDGMGIDSEFQVVDADQYLRFIGYVDEPEMGLSDDDGAYHWKARDFTALFLDEKRPARDIVPGYGDDLDVALSRIIGYMPGGENIGLRLEDAGLELLNWPNLGIGAPPGLGDAKVPVKADDTAWHYVKRACDTCALIPQIKLDTLVVATSRGLTTPARRAAFIYGENLLELHEKRNLAKLKEGIGLIAYSLADRKHVAAVFPASGDTLIAKSQKKSAIKRNAKKPKNVKRILAATGVTIDPNDKRKWFPYPAVANLSALEAAVEQVWLQRSRQEFEGSFKCTRMTVPEVDTRDTLDGDDFDVTDLQNGDRVMLDVLPEHRALLGEAETRADRIALLVERGVESHVASALVEVFEAGLDTPLEVYVRKASHQYSDDDYTLTVEYQNLISAAAG